MIAEKYKMQSQKAPLPLLINALEMFSKCDVQYKASRNQRLLVELTLMQACSLDETGKKKI
jgi:DNA polymerase-3 subunit gamma/tau